MTIGVVRICYIDGTIQDIQRAINYKLDNELGIYKIDVSSHYIFVNASQVRYIGRAFDIDNRG